MGWGKHGLLVVVGVGMRMLNGVGETWVVGCSWSRYKDVKRGGETWVVGCSWSRYKDVKRGVGNMGCWLYLE